MGRPKRIDIGGMVYHVLNRSNFRMRIFEGDPDYLAFMRVMVQAQDRVGMRVLAYCVMPNHWHMVLHPVNDGDLSRFMGWLSLTHTQRWHAHRHDQGAGHLYQGRYKSFVIDAEDYLVQACRYVERNALRAGLVDRAQEWGWGSLSQWQRKREMGDGRDLPELSAFPLSGELVRGRLANWTRSVNRAESEAELEALRVCVNRGRPYGSADWVATKAVELGIESTLRSRGRPKQADDSEG